MERHLLSFNQHGLNDHFFSVSALLMPRVIGLNSTSVKFYTILGISLFAYNALSDHRFAFKRYLSLKTHKRIDIANVCLLCAATGLPAFNKNKKQLIFHLGYSILATAHIFFSKWKKEPPHRIHLFI